MFEVALKNNNKPDLGAVTVEFPIPEDRYKKTIRALNKIQIGSVLEQDCCVADLRSADCPALRRMIGRMVSVDELDWLGKQLESFDRYELLQFNAAAARFDLSSAGEMIDLALRSREVTVISDFNDLDKVANGDGKCDDCGATVSLSIKWDAGTNGGTIDDKASITTTGKPNATATAPTSTPVKTGHAFKGWYTSASGGSLYNTVTITAAKTFYAQFTANSYTLTWDLGNGTTEETKQTYGEALVLPTEPTRKNAEFLGWFTEAVGGTQVDANTIYKTDGDSTYYAHWEITEVFSVTVPVVLPLTVDENGEVHVGAAEIINGSTGEVIVSSVSISTKNGWQLVPFDTDMAHEKVDARLLGFKINDSETTKTGDAETFSLTSPWTIAENGKLPLSYDAVVSAVSQPVTEQDVLSVVFVLEWKGE